MRVHVLFSGLMLLSLAPCMAQPAQPDAKPDAKQDAQPKRFDVHSDLDDVRNVIKDAGDQAGASYVLSREVSGGVGVHAYEVTFEELLDMVLPVVEARWYRQDGVIHIVSRRQYEALGRAEDKTDDADNPDRPEPDEEAQDEDADDRPRIHKADTMDLNVSHLDIKQVLKLLSIQQKQNFVWSGLVGGDVTARLKDVTFDQALEHLFRHNFLKRVDFDTHIRVMSDHEWQRSQATENESGLERESP